MNCKSGSVARAIVFTLSLTITSTWADIVSRTNIDSGWYKGNSGHHVADNDNYLVSELYNNFFIFDVSELEEVTQATLRIFTHDVQLTGLYQLYEVSTAVNVLRNTNYDRYDIYNDLENGTVFGSTTIDVSQTDQYIDIALNSAAIADINASESLWAIGGDSSGKAFAWSHEGIGNSGNKLILNTIPEPLSVAMIFLFYPIIVLRRHLCIGRKEGRSGQLSIQLNKLFSLFYLKSSRNVPSQDKWI